MVRVELEDALARVLANHPLLERGHERAVAGRQHVGAGNRGEHALVDVDRGRIRRDRLRTASATRPRPSARSCSRCRPRPRSPPPRARPPADRPSITMFAWIRSPSPSGRCVRSSRLWPSAGMNAATKTSEATCSGQSDAACVTTTPPMLWPTRIAGSGLAREHVADPRSRRRASVTSVDRSVDRRRRRAGRACRPCARPPRAVRSRAPSTTRRRMRRGRGRSAPFSGDRNRVAVAFKPVRLVVVAPGEERSHG